MSKKLNILPGGGFVRRKSAARKENLCFVIPIPYSSWPKEKAIVTPPKTARHAAATAKTAARFQETLGETGFFPIPLSACPPLGPPFFFLFSLSVAGIAFSVPFEGNH